MEDIVTNQKLSGRFWPFANVRLRHGLLLLLIVGLCIVNGLLIIQNRDLKAALARMDKQQFLKSGDQVPPLAVHTLSGQERMVNYAESSKTVLLVFQPQCPACELTAPHWREIIVAGERDQYQVFGISLGDGLKSNVFLTSSGLSLETFIDIDAGTKEAYKLNLTPLTIVIDNAGKVEKIWPGAFNRETKPDVERYFGISVADDVK